jgi:hypothetical protein
MQEQVQELPFSPESVGTVTHRHVTCRQYCRSRPASTRVLVECPRVDCRSLRRPTGARWKHRVSRIQCTMKSSVQRMLIVELPSLSLRVRPIPCNSVVGVPLPSVQVDFDHFENFAIVQGRLVLRSANSYWGVDADRRFRDQSVEQVFTFSIATCSSGFCQG